MFSRSVVLLLLLLCGGQVLAQPAPAATATATAVAPAATPVAAPAQLSVGPKLPLGDKRLTTLLSQGQAALQQGDAETALRAFEDAFRYSQRPVLLYYLGRVAQLQQRGAAAVDLFRRFIEAHGEEVEPEVRAEVQPVLTAYVTDGSEVSVQGEPGALLLVDGRLAGALPLATPLLLPAGSHQLALEKSKRRVETVVQILPRRQAEVRFTLTPPLALLTLTPGLLLILEPATLDLAMRESLRKAVAEAAQLQNAVLVTGESQADALQRKPELATCLSDLRCQEDLARRTAAQFVLRLEVQSDAKTGGKGGGLRFNAELLDVEVGMISVRAAQGCSDCSLKRTTPQLAEMVQELLRNGTARPRGKLKLTSDPPGAQVEVDHRVLGETPYERDTFIGSHTVVLRRDGYQPYEINITVEDGKVEERAAQLVAVPPPPPTSSTYRIAKWALLGSGIAAVVTGAILIGVGAQKDCSVMPCKPGPQGATVAGGVLLGAGVIAGGLSGYFFVRDGQANGAPTNGLTASLGLGGRF